MASSSWYGDQPQPPRVRQDERDRPSDWVTGLHRILQERSRLHPRARRLGPNLCMKGGLRAGRKGYAQIVSDGKQMNCQNFTGDTFHAITSAQTTCWSAIDRQPHLLATA